MWFAVGRRAHERVVALGQATGTPNAVVRGSPLGPHPLGYCYNQTHDIQTTGFFPLQQPNRAKEKKGIPLQFSDAQLSVLSMSQGKKNKK